MHGWSGTGHTAVNRRTRLPPGDRGLLGLHPFLGLKKFTLGGLLELSMKPYPSRAAKLGVHPFTKEGPILLKAKRAGYTVKLKLTKKFTKLVND